MGSHGARHPDTLAVMAGRGAEAAGDPVNVPVTFSSTFRAGGPLAYGRDGNPTWAAFEEAVGALEGGSALAFASGLAGVAAVVDAAPAGGVVVAPAGAYKGTRALLASLRERGRLGEVRLVDITDTAAVLAACEGAGLLWVESPTNPLLDVADLPALCAEAAGLGVPVAVDNTFASPLLQRPLAMGATWSVHSATKILSGHSDVVLGVVAVAPGRPEAAAALLHHRTVHGAIPGPMEAFLALRGLRTLPVRLERAAATAAELARRLAAHPAVDRVRYPGWGFMLAVEVAGGAGPADRVCERVEVAVPATSLGGVETTLERRSQYPGEEATPPGLLRVSVGLEHVEDLWADLAHALGP